MKWANFGIAFLIRVPPLIFTLLFTIWHLFFFWNVDFILGDIGTDESRLGKIADESENFLFFKSIKKEEKKKEDKVIN